MSNRIKIAADYTVKMDTLGEILERAFTARLKPIIWGKPGLGKTAMCDQVAERLNLILYVINAPIYESVDLRGIPWRDPQSNLTHWALPSFLPPMGSTDAYLVVWDELASAMPSVTVVLHQLLQYGRLSDYVLPENTVQVACSNRETHGALSYELSAPLRSRFAPHIEVKPDADVWLSWAVHNNIEPEILFFVKQHPDMIDTFDTMTDADDTFSCGRTLELASRFLQARTHLSDVALRASLRGIVGEQCATALAPWLKMWRQVPHPDRIIADPQRAEIPTSAAARMVLCGSLYRIANDANIGAIIQYVSRIGRDLTAFVVNSAIVRDPAICQTSAFIRYAEAKTA